MEVYKFGDSTVSLSGNQRSIYIFFVHSPLRKKINKQTNEQVDGKTRKQIERLNGETTYRHIPHLSQWKGFLSTPVKCLHLKQKYSESLVPQLLQVWLPSFIWNIKTRKILTRWMTLQQTRAVKTSSLWGQRLCQLVTLPYRVRSDVAGTQFLFWNRCTKFARNAAKKKRSLAQKNVCNSCGSDKCSICNFARSEEVEFSAWCTLS